MIGMKERAHILKTVVRIYNLRKNQAFQGINSQKVYLQVKLIQLELL